MSSLFALNHTVAICYKVCISNWYAVLHGQAVVEKGEKFWQVVSECKTILS